MAFGNVTVGTSTALLVTLTNTGTANVTISSISVSGNGFSVGGGSSVTLTSNQGVTISVNFSPAAVGQVQGTLTVASNASNSPLKLGVSGTGMAQGVQHSVNLSWQPSTSAVNGYFVYRGPAVNNLSRLTGSLEASTSYTDNTVFGGQTYVYAVSAVGTDNVEGAKSTPITVSIPSP